MFARSGYNGAKTRDIAEAAGVNEALLFRHFQHKEDLYAAILAEKSTELELDELLSAVERHGAQRDDRGYFEQIAQRLLAWYKDDPEFLRVMLFSGLERHPLARAYRDRHGSRLFEAIAGYVRLRQSDGVFCSIRPELAVRAFLGMVSHHALVTEVFDDTLPGVSTEEAAAGFTTLFLAGMRAESAPERSRTALTNTSE